MSQILHTQTTWDVGKNTAVCTHCQTPQEPGVVCWAALVENLAPAADAAPAGNPPAENALAQRPPFERLGYCQACWAAGHRPLPPAEMFSYWKTTAPSPNQKKRLFVDDSVLLDLFTRLQEKAAPQDVRFRFVLALVLMRKRLLKYEGSEALPQVPDAPAGAPVPELWTMIPRGENPQPVKVVNPQLTPEQIAEVSGQLSQILAEEI